jgi:hypothetical protein
MSGDPGREIAGGGKGAGGGESGGGSYANPHTGKEPKSDGIMGHGGQTEIDYSGPANPNAPTRGEDDETGDKPAT